MLPDAATRVNRNTAAEINRCIKEPTGRRPYSGIASRRSGPKGLFALNSEEGDMSDDYYAYKGFVVEVRSGLRFVPYRDVNKRLRLTRIGPQETEDPERFEINLSHCLGKVISFEYKYERGEFVYDVKEDTVRVEE